MRKTDIDDQLLLDAVEEMERGLVDADLGGRVYKKRIALPGRGKRGSIRTLIAANKVTRWIFLYGYEKNDRDNITVAELSVWRMLARDLLECSDADLDSAQAHGQLEEVHDVQ
jgi:hypothetical protein